MPSGFRPGFPETRQNQSKAEEPKQHKTEGSDAMRLRKMWADLVGEV